MVLCPTCSGGEILLVAAKITEKKDLVRNFREMKVNEPGRQKLGR